jgi:hypothetical protein
MGTGRANEELADLHFVMRHSILDLYTTGIPRSCANHDPKTRTIGIFHGRIIDAYNTMDKKLMETMRLAAPLEIGRNLRALVLLV